jgi:uncharacterized protein YndB with AHSA1/START domain
MPGIVKLHRVIAAPPERVFRAFTDPEALVKWLPPHGFTAKMISFDFRVGGSFRMSFQNFTTKSSNSFGGTYNEIKPNEFLCYSDKFDDPNLSGEMINSISFKEVIGGTEIYITQEGIPDVIPTEMCYLGWQQSLMLLNQLVEPTIPDGA